VAVALAAYANSLGGALFYDDTNAIIKNAWVHAGDPIAILTQPSWWGDWSTVELRRGCLWRPVTTLTFALNYALHGLRPLGYHVVNVALHAGVSVLVLAVFTRVTAVSLPAAIAALLFAAHPAHTEAVASVVGRAELLAAGGFFLAWLLFLVADDRLVAAGLLADEKARSRGVLPVPWSRLSPAVLSAAGVAAFSCAAMAKENALALLPVLILADLLYPRAGCTGLATLGRRVVRYGALAGASVIFVLVRATIIGPDPPGIERLDNPLVALPAGESLMTAIKVVGLYTWRLLFPLTLAADYSYQQIAPVTSLADPGFLAGLAVLIAVPALAWWGRSRAPALALAVGFMALTFAMVSNLVFPIGTIMAERLLYLPSAGFCLLLALVLTRVAELGARLARAPAASSTGKARVAGGGRRWERRSRRGPPVPFRLASLVGIVLVLYGARTWARNEVWRTPEIFFTAMVRDAPRSARSHRELGNVLAASGRFDDARRAFERSLAIKPGDPATLYNLGNAHLRAGEIDAAIEAYGRALAVKPDFADAMVNLGNAESLRGDHETALVWMRRALVLTPRSAPLHGNVANELFRTGALAEARAAYEKALALAPDAADILVNYGAFLYSQGEYDAAIAAYGRAAATPSPMALVGLAASYHAKGLIDEARAAAARAAGLFPEDPAVRQIQEALRQE
jgi:tetratricopeptide (TPR) repeat protein